MAKSNHLQVELLFSNNSYPGKKKKAAVEVCINKSAFQQSCCVSLQGWIPSEIHLYLHFVSCRNYVEILNDKCFP